MAKQISVKIISPVGQVDIKLENLSGKAEPRKVNGKEIEMKADGSPKIVYKNGQGDSLAFARKWQDKVIRECSNVYVDDKDRMHTTAELVPYYMALDGEQIPAQKFGKSDVFEIKSFDEKIC